MFLLSATKKIATVIVLFFGNKVQPIINNQIVYLEEIHLQLSGIASPINHSIVCVTNCTAHACDEFFVFVFFCKSCWTIGHVISVYFLQVYIVIRFKVEFRTNELLYKVEFRTNELLCDLLKVGAITSVSQWNFMTQPCMGLHSHLVFNHSCTTVAFSCFLALQNMFEFQFAQQCLWWSFCTAGFSTCIVLFYQQSHWWSLTYWSHQAKMNLTYLFYI